MTPEDVPGKGPDPGLASRSSQTGEGHRLRHTQDGEMPATSSIASPSFSLSPAEGGLADSLARRKSAKLSPRKPFPSRPGDLLPPLDAESLLESEAAAGESMPTVLDQYEDEVEDGEDDEGGQEERDAGEEGETLLRCERAARMRRMDEERTIGDMGDTVEGEDDHGISQDDFHDIDEDSAFARFLERGSRARGSGEDGLYGENDDEEGYSHTDDNDDSIF